MRLGGGCDGVSFYCFRFFREGLSILFERGRIGEKCGGLKKEKTV